jgi:hypothetical protein
MGRTIIGLFLAVCMTSGTLFTANSQTGPAQSKAGSIGVCYDEGLGARFWATDNIPLYGSIFYWVDGARKYNHQPLNTFAFKLGGGYSFLNWEKVKIPAVLEIRVKVDQGETGPKIGFTSFNRYNVWSLVTRVGIAPELFITDHFSIAYKLGLELGYIGSTFKLNKDASDLEKNHDDYGWFGTFGVGPGDVGSDLRFLEGFVFSIYF